MNDAGKNSPETNVKDKEEETENYKVEIQKDKKKKKTSIKEFENIIAQLEEENKRLKSESEQSRDSLLRLAAEFDNYKKRNQREFSGLIANANAQLIKEILQIIDELELSIKSSGEKKEFDSFYEGINLIYTKFLEILKQKGLKSIEAVGKEFNIDEHEAVMQIEKEGMPSNTVVEEYQKGYALNDRILRHSKVVVSK